MKKTSKLLLVLSMVAMASACSIKNVPSSSSQNTNSATTTSNEDTSKENVNISILEINDTHGYEYASAYNSNYNLASFGCYVDQVRNLESYDNVVTIANGDMFQGTAFSNLSHGKSAINAMNEVGFDMMGIGNHEFDWGLDEILQYFDNDTSNGEANFPLINGNVRDRNDNSKLIGESNKNDKIMPYTIVDKGGIKVGLLSYIGDQTDSICANKFGSYYIDCKGNNDVNFVKKVKQNAINCKNDGADIIVLNIHDGDSSGVENLYYNNAFAELEDDNGNYLIDAVINGHTHTDQSGLISRTNGVDLPVVQAYANLNSFGKIDLVVDPNTKKVVSATCGTDYLSSVVTSTEKKEAVQSVLDYEYSLIEETVKMKYATTKRTGSKDQIGKWTANIMKKYSDADVALINTGGIRSTMKSGDITIETLYQINPFDNSLVYVEVKGGELINFYNANVGYYYYNTDFDISNIVSSNTYKLLTIDYVYYGSYFQSKFANLNEIKVDNTMCARNLMGLDLLSKENGVFDPSDSTATLKTEGWPTK